MCPFAFEEPKCDSINQALQIIGDKWSGLIIYQLTAAPRRFSELEQALHIGPRTLSQRLDNLEAKQIISKHAYAEAPPRVEYSLTQRGLDLLPILQSMAEWSERYAGK